MKTLLSILLISISLTAFSQPYASLGLTNKGHEVGIGYLIDPEEDANDYAKAIDVTLLLSSGFSNAKIPVLMSFQVGKRFLLSYGTDDEGAFGDNYSITPQIGLANHTYSDAYRYKLVEDLDRIGDMKVEDRNKIKPIYRLTLAKDLYLGQFFIAYSRSGSSYYTFGIKGFIR